MCFTELTLHFPKSSSLPPHFFPLLLAIVYASHVKLFAEASELFTHAVFQLKKSIIGVHPSVSREDGSQRLLSQLYENILF
jgi:hypothetical protein